MSSDETTIDMSCAEEQEIQAENSSKVETHDEFPKLDGNKQNGLGDWYKDSAVIDMSTEHDSDLWNKVDDDFPKLHGNEQNGLGDWYKDFDENKQIKVGIQAHAPLLANIMLDMKKENSQRPSKASKGLPGYDLFSIDTVCIPRKNTAKIRTGIRFEMPQGICGKIYSRSGLVVKNGIEVVGGCAIVNSDFRGPVAVHMRNTSDKDYLLAKGGAFAQILFESYYEANFVDVDPNDHIMSTPPQD